jgi:hypothetical protein
LRKVTKGKPNLNFDIFRGLALSIDISGDLSGYFGKSFPGLHNRDGKNLDEESQLIIKNNPGSLLDLIYP